MIEAFARLLAEKTMDEVLDIQHELEEVTRSSYAKQHLNLVRGCGNCAAHRGCNRLSFGQERNWKRFRRTQHK